MYFTGCDAHSKSCTLQHIAEDGALGLSVKTSATKEGLNQFLEQLNAPTVVTFEAGRGYWWLYEFFDHHPKVTDTVVVDPRRSRRLSEELSVQKGYGRAKNDRIDTEMMAEQTRMGLAPRIQVPTPEQLERRTICRHRFELVHKRTSAINSLHGLLGMHGACITFRDLMGNPESKRQLFEKLPNFVKSIIEDITAQIDLLDTQILKCDQHLDNLLPLSDPQVKLLMTAPGVGPICARIIVTEIFDIRYFDAPKYLISYAGLAPIEDDSDGKKGKIKLNRHCNYYLKYAFGTAAHAARTHWRFRDKYQRDVKKHGKSRAKVNLARRLVKTVYWMLNRQQPFKF